MSTHSPELERYVICELPLTIGLGGTGVKNVKVLNFAEIQSPAADWTTKRRKNVARNLQTVFTHETI